MLFGRNQVPLMESGETWQQKKTIIKDSKGYGGIVNITRNKSALIRRSLTRHVLADVSAEMRQRSVFFALADKMMHEESKPTCLKRDEDYVKLLVDQIAPKTPYQHFDRDACIKRN